MENSGDCEDIRGADDASRPDDALLPLHIPKALSSSASKRRCNRVLAFSTCSLAIMIFVYFCLLLTQMVMLCIWATVHYTLETTLARTFAWEIIIQLFGSTYDDCTSDNNNANKGPITLTQMVPHDSCKYYHSPPVVSILAMALHVAVILSGIFYPLEKYIFRASSNLAFKMMLLSAILTVIFTGRNITMHYVYIGRTSNFELQFERLMRQDMKPLIDTPLHISKKWEITQKANLCCGVQNFTDWHFHYFQGDENPRYPMTCCDKTKSFCHIYPSRNNVFSNGCLSPELKLVYDYATQIIVLSFIALLTSILFVFLVHIIDTILLSQQNVGDPVQSFTKILFTRHANPSIKTVVRKLSTTNSSIKENDYDTKDMCIFTSNNFPNGSSAVNNAEDQFREDGAGGGDANDQNSIYPQQQRQKRSAFTLLNRNSTVHICVNSWGIACRTETSSVAKTLVIRKETQV